MSMKETYEIKMDCQIGEWSYKIEELQARAEKAGDEQKKQYYEYIKNLRAMQKEVQERLDGLRSSNELDWEEFRGGVDEAWGDLKYAIEVVSEVIQ